MHGATALWTRSAIPTVFLTPESQSVGVLFFLIPLALVVVTAAVLAFRWAVTDGQFDDLDTPSLRVLAEDAHPAAAPNPSGSVPATTRA
jgi:cbb3-type cytochrome oxidase maturation protein